MLRGLSNDSQSAHLRTTPLQKEISGYEHFKEGSCRLFEQAEIDRWNAMFAAEREQQAFAVEGGPPRAALVRGSGGGGMRLDCCLLHL